jgi:Peptidase_C39 like family
MHPIRRLGSALKSAMVRSLCAGSIALACVACSSTAPPASELSPAPPAVKLMHFDETPPQLATVLISAVPHVLQKPDFCGEATTEMFLRSKGFSFDQDSVFGVTGMDPARGMGATTRELSQGLTKLGFDVGRIWYTAKSTTAQQDLESLFRDLHQDLANGIPSIVCTHFDESPGTTEHFRLVLGYDQATDEVIYNDPALKTGGYLRMSRARFLRLWPLAYRADEWTVIRMRLAGQPSIPELPVKNGFSPADYAQHVLALKPMLQPEHTVVIEPPFVVVGDEAPQNVRARASGTVRWAVQHLKQDFFTKDPRRILTIWLFGSKASYDAAIRRHFPDSPDTPYGFYSSEKNALVMNIATGGGTLVHEIVHPFVEANVQDCPAWINEGLGSLFEQSGERQGHIIGLTNWRLSGLQKAIHRKAVPSFHALTHTTRSQFYEEDPGTNYSQSRYLFYYLQEHGLLLDFWKNYLQDRATDSSGYTTLTKILGEKDLDAFQKRWEAEVLQLRFP